MTATETNPRGGVSPLQSSGGSGVAARGGRGGRVVGVDATGDVVRLVAVEGGRVVGFGERPGFVGGGGDAGTVGRLLSDWHRGLAAAVAGLGGGGGDVDGVVIIAPPERTVCRVLDAPAELLEEGEAGIASACELLAEGALPGGVSEGRRGAGLVRSWRGSAWGGSGAAVLSTGWLGEYGDGSADEEAAVFDVRRWAGRRWVRAVGSPAAMASLCARLGSVCRGAVWRGDAGVAVVVADEADRFVARVTRVDGAALGGEPSAFDRLLEKVGAEAGNGGVRVGLTGAPAGAGSDLGDGVPTDLSGLKSWIGQYGLALGASLAGAEAGGVGGVDDRGAMLRISSGSDHAPLHQRVWSWSLQPRHAAALIVCGVLLAIGAPVGAEAVRVAVLSSRAGDVESRVAAARKEAALYDTMADRLLPMTKLMSDVAQAAPVGVRLDRVQISVGGGLDVRGQAEGPGLVDSFVGNLGRTGVFADVRRPSRTEAGGVTEFQVTAQVRSPLFHTARPIEDFAAVPLAERLYGESASGAYAADDDDDDDDGGGAVVSGSASRGRGGDAGEGGLSAGSSDRVGATRSATAGSRVAGGRAGAGGGGSAAAVPDPLTDEQIKAMSRTEAAAAFQRYNTASRRNDLDDQTRARLTDEASRLRRQMLVPGGGGTP